MQYLLLIYSNEAVDAAMSADAKGAMHEAYGTFTKSIVESGAFVGGDALQSVTCATTVRVRDGNTMTTDGPFAETKEQLGGYYLVDCETREGAIEIASRIPSAQHGSIEVRPIMLLDQ